MPLSYTIDKERGVVRTTATGRLTDGDLRSHKETLLKDPRFQPGMKELSDIRAIDSLEITPDGIAFAVRFDVSHAFDLKAHKLGLLVPNDFVFGMARMYEMRTEGNTGGVRVFRTEAEAKRWLDSP